MIDIIKKSIDSLLSKQLIRTSVICLIITAIILAVFVGGAMLVTSNTEVTSYGWLEKLLDYLFNAGAVIIAWFLFPVLTPLIASFFAEKVAEEVEKQNYHGRLARIDHKLSTMFFEALKFVFFMLLLNILCLPFYLIPVVNVIVYYSLNSYLISREFFDMAASCYMHPKEAKKLRRSNRLTVMGGGVFILLINNIPVVNLLGPIIAITLMVHLFFKLDEKAKGSLA